MGLFGFFYPEICVGCGYLGKYLCPVCEKGLLPIKHQRCFYCNKPSPFGITHPGCKKENGVDGFVCVFHYNNIFKKVIKTIKYRLVKEAMKDLLYITGKHMPVETLLYHRNRSRGIQIIPIPLHETRKNQRGFNQSILLSGYLSRLTGMGAVLDCLVKTKQTLPQAGIKGKKDRVINLGKPFSVVSSPPPCVFLVDDIVTTGTTISRATRELKKRGVRRVVVFSVAKG